MAGSQQSDGFELELPRGKMLGKFEVLRKIATGGMAEIYLARVRGRAGFEKLFVLKRILPIAAGDPRFIQMFLDEARLVATLQHPNIADVLEVGEDRGAPFFVMEHVHGQDVRTIRIAESERHQGVPLRVSLAIVHAIASALDYAHDRCDANGVNLNLVHRDVSPSNILVSYEGAIKLIDFGVARVTNQNHKTQAGTVRGKGPYMSPEQCRGQALDRRSDLFSLGVVLYELTVGKRPFRGASEYEIMSQIVHHDPAPPSTEVEGYPPDLERIVAKLLARNPDQRYQHAEEVLQALEDFLEAHHLWVPLKKLSRYMRKLFADRLVGWDKAINGDILTLAEHVAHGMEPGHWRHGEQTPPTPLPVIMQVAQELRAVEMDADVSLAQVYQPDNAADPMAAILATSNLEDSVVFTPDTFTTQAGDEDLDSVVHAPESLAPSGDTVTTPPGESEALLDPPAATRPVVQARAATSAGEDTITVRANEGDSGDTTTLRADSGQAFDVLGSTVLGAKREVAPQIHAESDSVLEALHAPTFMAAIDALGSDIIEHEPAETARPDAEVRRNYATTPGWSGTPVAPALPLTPLAAAPRVDAPIPRPMPPSPTTSTRAPSSRSLVVAIAIFVAIAVIAALLLKS